MSSEKGKTANNRLTSELRIFKQLFGLMRPFPLGIFAIVVIGLAASLTEGFGLSLFLPFLESLDQSTSALSNSSGLPSQLNRLFANSSEQQRIVIIPLCIFGAVVLKNSLIFGNLALFNWLNARISHRLRSDIFKQMLAVSDGYLNRQNSGQLLNILASETWHTSEALSCLVRLLISSCTVVVFIALMLLFSWRMTVMTAVVMILISVLVRVLTRQIKQLGQQAVQVNSQLSVRMCEGLAGMRTIRSFGREAYEQSRFDLASEQVSKVFFRLGTLAITVNPTYEVLGALLVLSTLVAALSQNWVDLPTLLIFVLILYQLQPRIKAIGNDYVSLLGLGSAVDTVLNFLDHRDKTYLLSGHKPFAGLQKDIQFENVSFRYEKDASLAVDQVSFSVPRGKTTALVGPSGSGKSTLINLLFRFYDPTAGAILVDGQRLIEINTADWRCHIAIVSQDIYLFSGSIYENIAYGRLDARDDDIVAAARQAHAHDFICQMPKGYQTLVGDRGINLSGGQRQRIALARAIVRDPEILILDEATNALDTRSESAIQEALSHFCRDRTVIAIAHRLSTIENADQIIVMQSGTIAERGTLHQLLSQNGLFAELYRLQYRHALSSH